jgi:hypothetical protein
MLPDLYTEKQVNSLVTVFRVLLKLNLINNNERKIM